MYQTEEVRMHDKIRNSSLLFCEQVAEKVKQPEYIPFFEAFTPELIGRYFGLTEKRIVNAHKSNRGMFENDCHLLTGPNFLPRAKDVKSLGKSYGHLCTFSNGVVALIGYGYNRVFNSRALLHFAVYLRKESEVAEKIYNILKKDDSWRDLPNMKPWFLIYPNEPAHAVAESDNHVEAICPYLAKLSSENAHPKDKPPVKAYDKAAKCKNPNPFQTRECLQLDEHGNIIHKWNSISEAANVLGIAPANIYQCCAGANKSTGGGRGKPGKYRFSYVN